jgi:transcription antitermination factor NusG
MTFVLRLSPLRRTILSLVYGLKLMPASWHTLHTKRYKEEFLRGQLEIRKIEAYCPSIRVMAKNPRSRKMQPYFPGYLFFRMDLDLMNSSTLQWMPGGSGLVSFGGEAALVPDGLIFAIKQRLDGINACEGDPSDFLKAGDAITIHDGPFKGYNAIFDTHLPGSERVRVLLNMLQAREVPVVLPAGQIQPKKRL